MDKSTYKGPGVGISLVHLENSKSSTAILSTRRSKKGRRRKYRRKGRRKGRRKKEEEHQKGFLWHLESTFSFDGLLLSLPIFPHSYLPHVVVCAWNPFPPFPSLAQSTRHTCKYLNHNCKLDLSYFPWIFSASSNQQMWVGSCLSFPELFIAVMIILWKLEALSTQSLQRTFCGVTWPLTLPVLASTPEQQRHLVKISY